MDFIFTDTIIHVKVGGGPRPQKALFYLRTPSKGPKKGGFLGPYKLRISA